MRKAVVILALAGLVSGCGGSKEKKPATTATQKAKPPAGPQYVPSAHHARRPRGFVYNDEVGENVTTATKSRIIQVFGPPATTRGKCFVYRVVRQPTSKWTFCFRGQKMVSASG